MIVYWRVGLQRSCGEFAKFRDGLDSGSYEIILSLRDGSPSFYFIPGTSCQATLMSPSATISRRAITVRSPNVLQPALIAGFDANLERLSASRIGNGLVNDVASAARSVRNFDDSAAGS